MNYCPNCGSSVNENQDVCLYCGHVLRKSTPASRNANDTGGFGWGLLGFCIPIVGLVLYLVWKDDQPLNARAAGKGALISVIIPFFFYIIAACGLIALSWNIK